MQTLPTDPARDGAARAPAQEPAAPKDDTAQRKRRFWVVIASHMTADIYPPFIMALAAVLTERLGLSAEQKVFMFALAPILSGAMQPFFAWISDKYDTRVFAPLGLLLCGVSMCSMGFAQSYTQLLLIQSVGMIGSSLYHPPATAVAGRAGRVVLQGGTPLAVFFTAGMLGGFLGAKAAPRVNQYAQSMGLDGTKALLILAIPAVLVAAMLWPAVRRTSHKGDKRVVTATHGHTQQNADRHSRRTILLLGISNAARFTVIQGLFYLYTEWATQRWNGGSNAAQAAVASVRSGDLMSASLLAQAVSVILIGRFVPHRRVRTMLVTTSVAAAAIIAGMPLFNMYQDGWVVYAMLAASFFSALIFFGAMTTTTHIAQQAAPHATAMTASLLMGIGWVVSASAAPLCKWVIGAHGSLDAGFWLMGGVLFVSAVAGVCLPADLARYDDGA